MVPGNTFLFIIHYIPFKFSLNWSYVSWINFLVFYSITFFLFLFVYHQFDTLIKIHELSLTVLAIRSSAVLFISRYVSDFVELEFIAAGGFGVVYKARNTVDHNEYAIKKIIVGYIFILNMQ